jgi:hypothetical protein
VAGRRRYLRAPDRRRSWPYDTATISGYSPGPNFERPHRQPLPPPRYLPFGFALLTFSFARRSLSGARFWRDTAYKLRFGFGGLLTGSFWSAVCWLCCRWYAMTLHISEPWLHRLLRY